MDNIEELKIAIINLSGEVNRLKDDNYYLNRTLKKMYRTFGAGIDALMYQMSELVKEVEQLKGDELDIKKVTIQ